MLMLLSFKEAVCFCVRSYSQVYVMYQEFLLSQYVSFISPNEIL